jgi:hypothetical protein
MAAQALDECPTLSFTRFSIHHNFNETSESPGSLLFTLLKFKT